MGHPPHWQMFPSRLRPHGLWFAGPLFRNLNGWAGGMGGLRKLHIEKLRYLRNQLQFAGYEFLVAMFMEVKGFWAVTPCRLACSYSCIGRAWPHRLQFTLHGFVWSWERKQQTLRNLCNCWTSCHWRLKCSGWSFVLVVWQFWTFRSVLFHPVPHSGHYMYHQFNTQNFHVLPTQCIYVFCVDLRTNSDYSPIQH